MKLQIDMPWERDLSVNHMRFGAGGGCRKKPHVQDWMAVLSWAIRKEDSFLFFRSAVWKAGRAFVTVDPRFPDKRRRDDHNYYKVICDAVAAGLGIDDKDIRVSTGTTEVDRERPGFTITVEDEG